MDSPRGPSEVLRQSQRRLVFGTEAMSRWRVIGRWVGLPGGDERTGDVVLRVIVDGSATCRVVTPHGRGKSVPSHVAHCVESIVAGGEALQRAEHAYPLTVGALRGSGWLDHGAVVRHVPASPHLQRIQIETQLTCNLACGYCYSTSGPQRGEALDPSLVRQVIGDADEMAVEQIDFTGGEFLMFPEWSSLLDCARSRGIAVSVHTNGTLVTPVIAEILARATVSHVQISVDSHRPEVHDKARRGRNALRRTLVGLDALASANVPTRIALMVHRDNFADFPATIEYFAKRYPQAVLNVDRVVGTTDAADQVGVSTSEFWDLVVPLLGDRVAPAPACGVESSSGYEPDCGAYYTFAYVTATGEVAACPTMTSREHPAFAGEDVRSRGLRAAWYDGEMFSRMRFTNCENVTSCPAGSRCGGGCRSNAYQDTGRLTGPDLVSCNVNKNPGTTFIDFTEVYRRRA